MGILIFITIFITGFTMGGCSVVVWTLRQVRKIDKVKSELLYQVKQKTSDLEAKRESITKRLIEAAEITKTQLALQSQTDMPSKNALHSRHKNKLIGELKDLEMQKISLLRSILEDGFDPTITIMTEDGTKEDLLLSKFLSQAYNPTDEVKSPKPDGSPSTRTVGKFVVHKGGKSDGTTH